MTESNERAAEIYYTCSGFHTQTNASTVLEGYSKRKKNMQGAEDDLDIFLHYK
jgi:hypothetical protein